MISVVPSAASVRAGDLVTGRRLLGRAPTSRRRRLRAWRWMPVAAVAASTGVALVALRAGLLLAVACAALLATGSVLLRDLRRGRVAARRHRELLTAVGVLAGELTAGARPAAALAAAAATTPAMDGLFGSAAEAALRGADAAALLTASGEPGVRSIGVAWRLVETTGAALTGVIERVAADLASADTQRRTVATALAGPRSSAALLSGLPALGIGLGAAMGAAPLRFLLGDPNGAAVCCAGVLLDVGGVLWMRRIVRRAQT